MIKAEVKNNNNTETRKPSNTNKRIETNSHKINFSAKLRKFKYKKTKESFISRNSILIDDC